MTQTFSSLRRRELVAAIALSPFTALAQKRTWPERPIRMVVGWPPGGSADTVARLLAERLSLRVSQPVVVETVRAPAAAWGRCTWCKPNPMAIPCYAARLPN
jgi:tripartite-type tricarboxylate transporter receptor subunit TctC